LGYERQPQDFYETPPEVTKALVRWVRLPNGIWEPFCGNDAISQVLEEQGHSVVSTDLVDRGYGEGGRDFMLEDRMPEGKTAIVTNPPYRDLFEFAVHALKLTEPVGGMVALMVNHQWQTGQEASKLCRMPAFAGTVVLVGRLDFSSGIGVLAKNRGSHSHCWLVWDWSRPDFLRRREPGKSTAAPPSRRYAGMGALMGFLGVEKNLGGRPPHAPTDQTRRSVEAMAGCGIPQMQIALSIGISDETLRKHYRRELDLGVIEANAKVAETLFRQATVEGNTAAAIWWTKARMGWR
jgi:hypothetical protein